MEDLELIKEFVIESTENLTRLDTEMVELEQRPTDSVLLASIFRTIHTIKGTCGFLGFGILERITHQAENILSQVRNGERELTQEMVSLILETVDAIKAELTSIETTAHESGATYTELIERLTEVAHGASAKKVECLELQPVAPALTPAIAPQPLIDEAKRALVASPAAPPAAPIESTATGAPKSASIADSTIRVDVGQLDKLMNLVGELVLARNQILQFNAQHEDAALNATSQRLNLITTELQENVMKTRMQPIGMIWSKLPRVVRDLAASCGKQISLEMEGQDTELDKTILEAIKDPLTHIVRNSCDHGIEMPEERVRKGKDPEGKLLLRAYHEGGHVNIEITDDGAGIDPQKVKRKAIEKGLLRSEQAERMRDFELVNLVFLPGFSTAAQVSNISGRGVGMDVVKTNIEKIGGVVDLASKPGEGTAIRIKIPLTLAIIPGLIVTLENGASGNASRQERFVIPQVHLVELLRLEGEEGRNQIESIHGTPVYRRRGKLLPIVYLNRVLEMPVPAEPPEALSIVVLQAEGRTFGLVVDSISDTQEIVVKALGKQLKGLNTYAGATIMGDGRVALILDVMGLAQRAGVISEARERAAAEAGLLAGPETEKQSFLLFEGPDGARMALPLDNMARLEELPSSQVEKAGMHSVAQYRGQILPLVHLESALTERRRHRRHDKAAEESLPAKLHVLVCNYESRQVGLVVERILDIVEDTAELKYPASRPGVLYSTVIHERVTELLDIPAILRKAHLATSKQLEAPQARIEEPELVGLEA